jgi:hypothetical protein
VPFSAGAAMPVENAFELGMASELDAVLARARMIKNGHKP